MIRKVVFAVCRNSLTALGATAQDLITGVNVVNSALAHIIMRQQQSWGYIKIGS
jgi:intracellular sulfur oxidation DsrE/DsrF family protein